MRWGRRTDDARRTKGDPPPTVDSLIVTVRRQGELIRELRAEVDRLRIVVAEKTEYVEQLAEELAEAKAALSAGLPDAQYVERLGLELLQAEGDGIAADPDVTRPYIPEYEAWKDETR